MTSPPRFIASTPARPSLSGRLRNLPPVPLAISAAVGLSLLVALTVVPVLTSILLGPRDVDVARDDQPDVTGEGPTVGDAFAQLDERALVKADDEDVDADERRFGQAVGNLDGGLQDVVQLHAATWD